MQGGSKSLEELASLCTVQPSIHAMPLVQEQLSTATAVLVHFYRTTEGTAVPGCYLVCKLVPSETVQGQSNLRLVVQGARRGTYPLRTATGTRHSLQALREPALVLATSLNCLAVEDLAMPRASTMLHPDLFKVAHYDMASGLDLRMRM